MVGDEYLRFVQANIFQSFHLNLDAIEPAYQAAPYLRYTMRKIPAPVKNPAHCGNDSERKGKENYQRPKPDGMIDGSDGFQEQWSFFWKRKAFNW